MLLTFNKELERRITCLIFSWWEMSRTSIQKSQTNSSNSTSWSSIQRFLQKVEWSNFFFKFQIFIKIISNTNKLFQKNIDKQKLMICIHISFIIPLVNVLFYSIHSIIHFTIHSIHHSLHHSLHFIIHYTIHFIISLHHSVHHSLRVIHSH